MYLKKIVLLCMTVALLVGCQNPTVYNQAVGNVADVTQRTKDAFQKSDQAAKPEAPLVVNQGLYVDKTPINLAKQPTWLKNRMVIRGEELPFSYYSRSIASGGGSHILTRYQVGLDPAQKVSLNYSGTVRGALDLLAAKSGYVYSVNGNNVYWQAFVTRTFDIAFMPGSSDYMMGKRQGSGSLQASGGGVSAIMDDSASSQYSNFKGTLSVWKDLEKTVNHLMSADGKVMVSEATTSVTVRDRPTNVDLISKFIANLNSNLSKQVLVKVQVLEITLASTYSFGINWNVVQTAFGGSVYQLNADYGTPISITGAAVSSAGLFFDPTQHTTGFTTLVKALQQQGKVSVVSEPRVVCLNNQVSVIRIVSQEGYLASVQNTTVAGAAGSGGVSNGMVTSQITPGTLITGLTLYILPKIMGTKVFLQVNADLSNKMGIDTISSTTGNAPTASNTSSIIQVPRLAQKQFNQRSMIGSGDTLILSGFRRIENTANASQLYDQQALGGKGAIQSNSETVVLITPIILHGYA